MIMTYYNPYLQQMQPIQMQQTSIIYVPSEEMARNYPVAPGNNVTFKNESAPFIYTKTAGYSQYDKPCFEIYKRVDEEKPLEEPKHDEPNNLPLDEIKAEIGEIRALYEDLKDKIDKPKRVVKKELTDDEQ